ncbi:hypothetical protein AB0E63_20015 [Kribbella sp. NPDC026596]|uniref:hypothetical protein n=1 Tax=Kribbella sp. NPDC026596 TaxID=3155122 RepID=UPI003405074F
MRTVFEEVKSWHRPLMLMVLAMAGLTVTAAVGGDQLCRAGRRGRRGPASAGCETHDRRREAV